MSSVQAGLQEDVGAGLGELPGSSCSRLQLISMRGDGVTVQNVGCDTVGNVTALVEDVWNNVTAFDQTYSGQFLNGFSYSTSILTANVNGLYKADYSITFSGTANNKYHAAIGVNNIQQLNTETHDKISVATDILSSSGTGFVQLSDGDKVTLMMMNEDSGGDATVFSVNVNLVRIGD